MGNIFYMLPYQVKRRSLAHYRNFSEAVLHETSNVVDFQTGQMIDFEIPKERTNEEIFENLEKLQAENRKVLRDILDKLKIPHDLN